MHAKSAYDRVVELLNEASLQPNGGQKVILLKQVQELIIHQDSNLLDNFFDEMLGFQSDKSIDVKKFVISFLEHACKVDGDILSKIIGNLNMMLHDENVNIRKKVMLSMSSLYKTAIKWLVNAKVVTEVMQETWKYLVQMREHIVTLLDDDNDGIRTHAVKYCEAMVLVLSPLTSDSEAVPDDQALDVVPTNHPFLKKDKMEEDGRRIFRSMLEFLASQSITSVNLMSCMTSLTNIARRRCQYLTQVVEGFEALHVNLPPTLANSQVSSVRKSLKLQMLALLRHPAAIEIMSHIATLLTDLGATQAEVSKAMPRPNEIAASRKRKADAELELHRKKSAKSSEFKTPMPKAHDEDDDDGDQTPFIGNMKMKESKPPPASKASMNPVEVTMEDIVPRLDKSNVADLVLLSMVMLPEDMPAHFTSTYTPIAAAGTPAQIKHIARLLSVQLTNAGLGKGVEEQRLREKGMAETALQAASPNQSIAVIESLEQQKPQFVMPLTGSTRKMRAYDLQSVTKPLSAVQCVDLATMAVQRIIKSESDIVKSNMNLAFCKVLAGLATQFGGFLKQILQDFIFTDIKNHADVALSWLYAEYAAYQRYVVSDSSQTKPSIHSYDECLTRLLTGILERKDQPGSAALFTRLIFDAPLIPSNAITVLKKYCMDERNMYLGMHTLRELMVKRPILQQQCLAAILDFSYHDKPEVRSTAIQVIKDLYSQHLRDKIDEFCFSMIENLVQPLPTAAMFPGLPKTRFEKNEGWSESTVRLCLYLYLSLLPEQASIYLDVLANTYVKASSDVKRAVLRVVESPIKQLGMESEHLLNFIRNCPRGSETLVTRIIHILTEKAAPSKELVNIVKQLYQERVADVRFIIPVLGGLQKQEIHTALPKLIKLNPVVVKEVFNRLLGVGVHIAQDPAMSPVELMVALHSIDSAKCDIKVIIKATTMCFQEKSLFTQEVLAVVMQQLIEAPTIPTLFMRTVIQSLAMYPKLLGFVMNILQRLIAKQVWKQRQIWEGFVRCCQRTRPQSFQVLLQLPAAQLRSAFEIAPDLREPLLNHVHGFSAHQRAHLPKAVLAALEKQEVDVKSEPVGVPVSEGQSTDGDKSELSNQMAEDIAGQERNAVEDMNRVDDGSSTPTVDEQVYAEAGEGDLAINTEESQASVGGSNSSLDIKQEMESLDTAGVVPAVEEGTQDTLPDAEISANGLKRSAAGDDDKGTGDSQELPVADQSFSHSDSGQKSSPLTADENQRSDTHVLAAETMQSNTEDQMDSCETHMTGDDSSQNASQEELESKELSPKAAEILTPTKRNRKKNADSPVKSPAASRKSGRKKN